MSDNNPIPTPITTTEPVSESSYCVSPQYQQARKYIQLLKQSFATKSTTTTTTTSKAIPTVGSASIMVMNATSYLGSNMVKTLLSQRFQSSFAAIYAFINVWEKDKYVELVQELGNLGAKIYVGDIINDNDDTILKYLTPIDTVINCTELEPNIDAQLKLILYCKKAGVRRYIPADFDFDADAIGLGKTKLIDEKIIVRRVLQHMWDIDHLIIMNGLIMEYLLSPDYGGVDIDSGIIYAPGSFDTLITTTAIKDICYYVAEIIEANKLQRAQIRIAGDTLSFSDIADKIEKYTGKKTIKRTVTSTQIQATIDASPNDEIAQMIAIIAGGIGTYWNKRITYNERFSTHRAITVDDFLAEMVKKK